MGDMIYFTSDTHFGHKNIIKYCKRPFGGVEEMDEEMVSRWNAVVRDRDTVYHLGDFGMGRGVADVVNRLKGKIMLVPGDHDGVILGMALGDKIRIGGMIEQVALSNGALCVLCHYPMMRWRISHYGSIHLFGHCHGGLEGEGLSFDVGVDCNEFAPVSEQQVIERARLIVEEKGLVFYDKARG
jgi:calcineurin-like phosphoesterase family protein